jgi:ABC-type sugar transport system ATPase subunit
MIEIRSVSKRFPGVTALDDVSLEIQAGELHSICGENGAGKSTLMKILSGVLTEYEGSIVVRGDLARFTGTRDAERAGISIIHQELNLVDELSLAANIFLGREICSGPFLDNAAMRDEAARLFAQLECPLNPARKVKELRVGDQQLVEIAKALSLQSEILIMDEPTSALTEGEVDRLFRVVQRLRDRGVTILYISHKMDEVFRLSDRITVMRDGRVVRTLDRSGTTAQQVTHLMVGREIEQTHLAAHREPGAEILKVRNLSLPWPGHARRYRLENISLSLRRGEILGIAGLMGAGRTELVECLFGANSEPVQGEILLDDLPVRFSHPAEAKAAGIAMVSEDRKRLGLFSEMGVRENITLCTLAESTSAGLIQTGRERAQAAAAVAELGIRTASTETAITSLSGGNQQKCIIARWLKTQPRILLLDDPTRGIDVGAKAELYTIIDKLCRDGLALIVTSSELPELITLCDRILVLCEGRLMGELRREEFSEQRIMELATAQLPVETTG